MGGDGSGAGTGAVGLAMGAGALFFFDAMSPTCARTWGGGVGSSMGGVTGACSCSRLIVDAISSGSDTNGTAGRLGRC